MQNNLLSIVVVRNLRFTLVILFLTFLFQPHISSAQSRTSNVVLSPQTLSSVNLSSLANAILTPDTTQFLAGASFSGADAQAEVFIQHLQGFPTNGSSFLVLSSGVASQAPGTASTFVSNAVGGGTGTSPDGFNAFDVATLTLTLTVPNDAQTLFFDFKFGTEENPTYLGSGFQDFFTAKINGVTNVARLPNNDVVTVDNADPFSNDVTGDSTFPTGEFPSPNDVVYNAVLRDIQTASFDLTPFRGQTITIVFQVGDASDSALDSAEFIDNLRIERGTQQMINPTVGGKLIRGFKPQSRPDHLGIDIDSDINLQPVLAVADGTVFHVATADGDCGDWVWIFHNNTDISKRDGTVVSDISTTYLHMTNKSVNINDQVVRGQQIGKVDTTGIVTGTHLHFGVRQGSNPPVVACKGSERPGDPTVALDPLEFVDHDVSSRATFWDVNSPVDMILRDPDGLMISKQENEIPEGEYIEVDYLSKLNDGEPSLEEGVLEFETIRIDPTKEGDYLLEIAPESGSSRNDVYSLLVTREETTITLAENIRISDIPSQPYMVRVSDEEIEKIVPVKVRIAPKTLNLGNKGLFSAIIEISKGFGVSVKDINPTSIKIQGISATRTTIVKDKFAIAFFKTQDLGNTSSSGSVALKLTGTLKDGTKFEGTDTVKVVGKGKLSVSPLTQLANALTALQTIFDQLLVVLER